MGEDLIKYNLKTPQSLYNDYISKTYGKRHRKNYKE
jgi:hypothetical protein